MVIKCKITGFDNLITIYGGEKNITRKMEKHENETYLLFAYRPTTNYYLATTTFLHQLLFCTYPYL
jgi:hypothetical protein